MINFSDKWCEQGGYFDETGGNKLFTISLLKGYQDTNYYVQFSIQGNNQDNYYDEDQWIVSKTLLNFTYFNSDQTNCYLFWETKGYVN